jgi:sulfite dehydrogenase
MLSTISLVVAGLSTSSKIGLVVVAAAFIIFALVSSFVLPRRNPDFPGKYIGLYVVVAFCFFIAMLAAVIVFGREAPAAKGSEGTTTTTASAPPSTTTTSSTTTSGTTSGVVGDPTAGKAVFLSAGCSGCHTLKAAGATGNVGPNLDQLKPAEARIKTQVINGGGPMPSFKSSLSAAQIQNVAAYVYVSTHP